MKLPKYLLCVCLGVLVGMPEVAIAQVNEHFVLSSTRAKVGSRFLRAGDGLSGSDELEILSGGKVVVLCRNETRATFTTSVQVSDKCPSSSPQTTDNGTFLGNLWEWIWRERQNSHVQGTRGSLANVPYVLSPRQGAISTTRPEIRWNPVEGAVSYTVQLSSPSGEDITWDISAADLNFQYPTMQPALTPSETYTVKITTSNFIASTEDGQTVTIEALDAATQAELSQSLAELQQREFSPATHILLESLLYEDFELYSQAIATLAGYVQDHPDALELRERLAELYSKVGLPREEQQQYEQIVGRSPGDITEIRYRALERLAAFAEVNREKPLAAEYRAESQQIAQQLGL